MFRGEFFYLPKNVCEINKVTLFYLVLLLYVCVTKLKSMETSVLTTKGQLLIPKRLRTKYGIKSGVKVIFEETKDGLIIKPMDEHYFESLAGILKSSLPSTNEYMKMKQEEKELEERKMNLIFGKAKKSK